MLCERSATVAMTKATLREASAIKAMLNAFSAISNKVKATLRYTSAV